jgi:hypothetical protein
MHSRAQTIGFSPLNEIALRVDVKLGEYGFDLPELVLDSFFVSLELAGTNVVQQVLIATPHKSESASYAITIKTTRRHNVLLLNELDAIYILQAILILRNKKTTSPPTATQNA